MNRTEFIACITTLLQEEGWQAKKCRTIKSSMANQLRAMNKIAKALGIDKVKAEEMGDISFA